AAPQMLNLESYQELAKPRDLAKIFQGADYTSWRSFRESEDARYVALTMPRVLARLPYRPCGQPVEGLDFAQLAAGHSPGNLLWMSAAWACAVRVTAAFAGYGWPARTCGLLGGGKVEGLPLRTVPADDGGAALFPAEVALADRREPELSDLGFLPLLHDE